MMDQGSVLQRYGAWLWPLLIFLLAFAQYANTLGHDYAWDDRIVITGNPRTQMGLAGIPAHFEFKTREVLSDFTGYRPVTMATFCIDYALFGLDPFWGHLHNVLLYGLLCCILFWTLPLLAPAWTLQQRLLATLIFLVHPLHAEVVANVKSRDEILALLLGLLAINAFLRHGRGGHWGYLLISGAWMSLACLSKENAVLLLPVMGLAAGLLLPGGWLQRFLQAAKSLIPLAIVLGVFYLLTGALPGTPSPVNPVGYWEDLRMGNSLAVPMTDYDAFGNSMGLFLRYVGRFLLPLGHTYHSGYNQIPAVSGMLLLVYIGGAFAVVAGGLVLAWRSSTRVIGFGLLFFAVTIVLYLHLFRLVLSDTQADRFMFTPSVGLSIALVAALSAALARFWPRTKGGQGLPAAKWAGFPRANALPALCLLVAVPMAGATWLRNPAWHDSLTLFETDMPRLTHCAKAHYYLAEELGAGLDSLPDRAANKARIIQHYEAAIAITPLAYYAFDGLGNFYHRERQFAEAQAVFARMCAAFPEEADPWFYQGREAYELGQYGAAALSLERSRGLRPEAADTWELQAQALTRDGQVEAAMDLLETAIPRFPQALTLHAALSQAYLAAGDTAGSFMPLEYLIATEPQNPLWWKRIIGHSQLLQDERRASFYYQKAIGQGVEF
jgi:Tfp pilus assembly protein PilF